MIAGLIIGFVFGICFGLYAGWGLRGEANTTVYKNVTVKLNAQDLIDIKESEDELEEVKKELGL